MNHSHFPLIRRAALLPLTWLICSAANAQEQPPNVQAPQMGGNLPPIQLPIGTDTLNAPADALNPLRLRDLRELRVRELLRDHRDILDAEPSGAPIVKGEVIATAPTAASLSVVRSLGFTTLREFTLLGLDVRVVVLAPPSGQSPQVALRRLRRSDPTGQYDYNHVYIESGFAADELPRPATGSATRTNPANKVGLIDAGIATSHPIFNGVQIEQFGCSDAKPSAHGTAVASLLVGNSAAFSGAAPQASLFAADVYCGEPTGGSVEKIAAAFDWLHKRRVGVINVSAVGPPNILLQRVIEAMQARGHLIVAAVGNDGPDSRPLFPAAYAGVIGVTGVDLQRKVLAEAVRGSQVRFSAPGTDMSAAGVNGGFVAVRGTSFAAPIVAGMLAKNFTDPGVERARRALANLDREAIDLGTGGIDKVYGLGLVGEAVRVEPAKLATADK